MFGSECVRGLSESAEKTIFGSLINRLENWGLLRWPDTLRKKTASPFRGNAIRSRPV